MMETVDRRNPTRYILPGVILRRERTLPVSGKVLVRVGQPVNPEDDVAEAKLAPEYRLVNLGRGLGVRAEDVTQYLQVASGSIVFPGDILAGPVGLMRRVVRAPQAGKVIAILDGQLVLELETRSVKLKAGYPGVVTDLLDERGILLETRGDLIQGTWGNGGMSHGQCVLLARAPQHVVTANQLNTSHKEKIICAGHCEDQAVIRRAASLSLAGLVLSSLNPALVNQVLDLAFPVVILEGFGKHPMNKAAFQILQTNDRQAGYLNAGPSDPYSGSKPELLIASGDPDSARLLQEPGDMESGQIVRVIASPYLGKTGRIANPPVLTRLPCGIHAEAVEVRLEDGEIVHLPVSNLEILVQSA